MQNKECSLTQNCVNIMMKKFNRYKYSPAANQLSQYLDIKKLNISPKTLLSKSNQSPHISLPASPESEILSLNLTTHGDIYANP